MLDYLKKLRTEIAFIQESHLTKTEHQKLKREWVGQVYTSSFNSKARGAVILLHKNLPFSIEKNISDPAGRYILIQGNMYSETWTLLNVYAPNYDDHSFIQELFLKVTECSGNILIGRDFNFCLDPVLDSNTVVTRTKSARSALAFMKDLNLCEAWRHLHPTTRDDSFYSCPHNSHTRIDFFLTSNQLNHRLLESEYLPRIISDHSPLTLSLSIPEKIQGPYRWRLNPTLLKKPDFCQFIRNQIKFFCETNCPSTSNSFIIWDTTKAFLRGQIISYTIAFKKKHMTEINDLEREISHLEKEHQMSHSRDIYQTLVNKKLQYNLLNTYRIEKNILRTKQRYYELGEKAQKVLAWQLKAEEASRAINSIETENGNVTGNPKEINDCFKNYYSTLYTSEFPDDPSMIDSFLSNIDLPKLTEEEQEEISSPLTPKEIEKAISSLNSNKSPGEDGFSLEFYKEFKDLLVPLFMDVVNLATETQTLPDSFSMVLITVIHKKNKNPKKCSSYRPISLLNID